MPGRSAPVRQSRFHYTVRKGGGPVEDAIVWEPVWRQEYVAVTRQYGFGTDAMLLADFAAPRSGERVVELGTGCGAIALRLCATGKPAAVHGIDIAPDAIRLCRRSAGAFSGAPVPTFSVGDWRQPRSLGDAGSARLVVCNPPYFPPDTGALSAEEPRRQARHAAADTLAAVCAAARWLLQNGGRFCLCHRPEYLNAVLAAATVAGLEPKRLRPVHHHPGAGVNLILVEARRGGSPGLRWENDLYLYTPQGEESPELRAIYRRS